MIKCKNIVMKTSDRAVVVVFVVGGDGEADAAIHSTLELCAVNRL